MHQIMRNYPFNISKNDTLIFFIYCVFSHKALHCSNICVNALHYYCKFHKKSLYLHLSTWPGCCSSQIRICSTVQARFHCTVYSVQWNGLGRVQNLK